MDKLNLNANNRELKELLDNAENHKTLSSNQREVYRTPEKLARHFNDKTQKTQTLPACIQEIVENPKNISINEDPSLAQKVQETLKNLKSKKSSPDVPAEIIKAFSQFKHNLERT